ncbi:MAG: bifunctional DNA-formamidopyrimidine glycosylase/DNA-(apurinic or apyrimidinic site) lyase [Anaerolineales bacterium]|nr:MAG: bifunctional DNA-formamidopyrimidine glycosylase/DNA-(apurinic or apyrimidinic site) lyase [Anaerolineales bacterium]
MPELPEVESIARKLKPDLIGRKILSADLRWARTLAVPTPKKFAEQIKGQKFLGVGRRAKYLDLRLTSFHLLIHLRMSGDLHIKDSANQPEKHDRLIIKLSGNKSLAFNDTRKFGRVWLIADPTELFSVLGTEPLSKEFTPQWLHAALHKKHRQLKPLLLDQTFLAGLGNIYSDEALNIAKLHPLRESSSVTAKQAKALHDAIRNVLNEGIRRNGASIDWVYRGGEFQNYFRAYDREGEPCKNCGAKIKRIVVGQRSTHYCPRCQRLR